LFPGFVVRHSPRLEKSSDRLPENLMLFAVYRALHVGYFSRILSGPLL
jgi:hypothetical protein